MADKHLIKMFISDCRQIILNCDEFNVAFNDFTSKFSKFAFGTGLAFRSKTWDANLKRDLENFEKFLKSLPDTKEFEKQWNENFLPKTAKITELFEKSSSEFFAIASEEMFADFPYNYHFLAGAFKYPESIFFKEGITPQRISQIIFRGLRELGREYIIIYVTLVRRPYELKYYLEKVLIPRLEKMLAET